MDGKKKQRLLTEIKSLQRQIESCEVELAELEREACKNHFKYDFMAIRDLKGRYSSLVKDIKTMKDKIARREACLN